MVLVLQGPVAASRFGLSWALMSMLLVVFSGWPMSQAARFSRLATERDFGQLHRRFRTLLWASTGLLVLACLAILMLFWGLGRHVPALAERFAGLGTIALLLAAAVVQHVVACFGPYLRAERTDPLLKLSVAGSLATFVGCWFAARHGDIAALAATYLACSAAGLPYCLWRAAAMRKRWGASDRAA
jgi:Na+/pantothenate symporter